jgi:hypothetical protein
MEEERECFDLFGSSKLLEKKREPLWRTGKGINTPLPPNSHLSAVVLGCGTASLQVRHCRTHQDSKRWEKVKLTILAEV